MIRQATTHDLQEILEIYNEVIKNTTAVYSYEPVTIENREQWYEIKKQENTPIFVYELEGKVVGFATYGPFRAWPAYKYSVELSIHIHENFRGQGIATILLTEVINDATKKEFKTIIAGIDADNIGSIKLHEKFGFTHSGTIQNAGYKFGQWLNLAFYQLHLNGPKKPIEK